MFRLSCESTIELLSQSDNAVVTANLLVPQITDQITMSCLSYFSVDLVDDDKNLLSTSSPHIGRIFVLGKEYP